MLIFGTFSLLFLYQRKTNRPTKIYGVKKRYKIPVFRPAAKFVESPLLTLLTNVVRHIAHWANVITVENVKNKQVRNTFFMSYKDKLSIDRKD